MCVRCVLIKDKLEVTTSDKVQPPGGDMHKWNSLIMLIRGGDDYLRQLGGWGVMGCDLSWPQLDSAKV